MVTECRFWKYTMHGEHAGYCELNRGTPLDDGEVIGQKNVQEIYRPNGVWCMFKPFHHEP